MAVSKTESTCSNELNLLINHGPKKHSIILKCDKQDHMFTVQNLAEFINEVIGVPLKAQRIIHKGKSLKDMSASLSSYGIKSGSKIMVIGRKCALEDDPNYKMLIKVEDLVENLQKQLEVFVKDFNGIKQGFLQENLARESVNRLIMKTKGIIEESMKKLEMIDSLELDTILKKRRKNLVYKIQSLLDRADEFIKDLKSKADSV